MAKEFPRLPKLERLDLAIAVEVYLHVSNSEYSYIDIRQVYNSLDGTIGYGLLRRLVDKITSDRTVALWHLDDDENISLSNEGFDLFIKHSERPIDQILDYSKFGSEWVFGTNGTDAQSKSLDIELEKPEQDTWEPLPLDRENPEHQNAIDRLDEVIELTQADNGYAATYADERNFVVSALSAGSKALKEQAVIYRIQFKALIWEPLVQLAARFGDNAIGIAASAAKEAIKEYLKDHLKGMF